MQMVLMAAQQVGGTPRLFVAMDYAQGSSSFTDQSIGTKLTAIRYLAELHQLFRNNTRASAFLYGQHQQNTVRLSWTHLPN